MAQTKYNFSRKGEKDKHISIDSEHGVSKGDVVSLKDGKRAKVRDVVLNLETGVHDVTIEDIADEGEQPRPTADGNDPNPESKAVKDVLFDPAFSPKIIDAVVESNTRLDRSHDIEERRKKDSPLSGHASSPAGPHEKAAAK